MIRNKYIHPARTYQRMLVLLLLIAFAFMLVPQVVTAADFQATLNAPDTDSQVKLEWVATAGVQKYTLQRSTGSSGTTIATLGADRLAYVDSGLKPGTAYTYTLNAYTKSDMTDTPVQKTTTITTTDLIKPYNLKAVYNVNTRTAALTWNCSKLATGSIISQTVNGVTTALPATGAASASVLISGSAQVEFTVQSIGTGVQSAQSDAVSVLPVDAPMIYATYLSGTTTITWSSFPVISQFQLERSKWNGTSWDGWAVINMMLTGTSATDTPSQGGRYRYRLNAKNGSVYAGSSNIVDPNGGGTAPSLPNKPGTLTAGVTSSSSSAAVKLNWSDQSNNELGFKIERLADPGSFVLLATVPPNTTTYTDSSISVGNTYIYRVCATNEIGDSVYTNEVTINKWDTVAPATLTVTPVSSSRIDLSWSYTGTERYNTIIERKTGTGGTWTPIYTTSLGTVKYSDTGLAANTRYFYRVKKALGTGSAGIPYPNDNIGIGAYTFLGTLELKGEGASEGRIYLSWTGNNAGADIIIERKMPNGSFSALMSVGPSTNSWYDNTGLVPGAAYTYRIKAQTSTNESLYSSEVSVQNTYLEPPSELTATIVTGSAVTLKWKDNSKNESGFEIWRYIENNGTYTLYASVGKNVTTFTDKLVNTGVQYSYEVRAYVSSGNLYSPFSGTATVGIGLIKPPANLTYEFVSSTQILLKWTDTSDNESGFNVEWKKDADAEWSVYEWMGAGYTACQVTGLNPYTKYYFRVRAYNNNGNVDSVSNEIIVSTALPAAPSDVKAVSLSASQAKITWKDNSDSEVGFKVLSKPSNGYYFVEIASLSKDTTSYIDSKVAAGSLYYYKVVSYNATGSSESEETSVTINTRAYFSDLRSVSWAREAIENLAGMGILQGTAGTLFNPNGTITKAEFTAIVVRAFNFDTATVGSLADVKSNKWYYKDIMVAENLGVISGDSKNKFYPETPITREEIAKMLFKALQVSGSEFSLHDNSVLEKFIDKNRISPDAVASVATLVGEGIIEGITGKTIGPGNTATRAQAAVFVYRTLNKLNK